jgi:flavin-dependent dehydrogenase
LIDLAIIGGGPAGSAAALEARRRGLKVTIWDRERFPRDKVCGEFLSAESVPLLENEIPEVFGNASVIDHAEFVSARGRVLGFALPHPSRGLSRRALDEALWRAAARAGAATREGEAVRRVRRLHANGDASWEIEAESGEAEAARSLVIACGRWWRIEGLDSPARSGNKKAAGQWLGVKAHFRGVEPRRAVEMFYFPGGYCGIAPVEDGLYNACCLVHRDLARSGTASAAKDFAAWIGAIARHEALNERLRGAVQEGETVTTAPVRPARRCASCDGALFAGDAAGFLDPFTGDGISMALHSGRLAAEVFAENSAANPARRRRSAALEYEVRLRESVRRSFAVAGALRTLVRAPGAVQEVVAAAMIPHVGERLHAGTRWRSGRDAFESAPEKQGGTPSLRSHKSQTAPGGRPRRS